MLAMFVGGLSVDGRRSWTGRERPPYSASATVRPRQNEGRVARLRGKCRDLNMKSKTVVVTGASKGLGLELAREFAKQGHSVVMGSRDVGVLEAAAKSVQRDAREGVAVLPLQLDVREQASIEAFWAEMKQSGVGSVDMWVNNAGTNAYNRVAVYEQSAEDVALVVDTNLKGTLLCCRQAILCMREQPFGGHIFNVDGAGVFGTPTAGYAAYGATKRAQPQLMKSLNAELKGSDIQNIGVHLISPGLVLTDLLLAGSTPAIRFFFNFLAEEPATVATWLVPRMVATTGRGQYHKYLKVPFAFLKIATGFVFRQNRYFDRAGVRVRRSDNERFSTSGVRLPEDTQ
ncbi:Chlorophyll(ide) b reductase NOL, chloroplastic [Porphyridium purpureum]|uniref:Chlorophyll(Ide) b reductase NOL, chloroplastic n=1 Tax=Porphyridium purpureum TaxID=35688 RepID=A0A5J4Z2T0_PORPP|nr:Chlorophyll(ide) b reductase NOL, chloroplastic [Porphyridium purpureum]|eukprot:POR0829..scf208_2